MIDTPPRMKVTEAAEYLGLAKQTLYQMRHRGDGPVSYTLGGRLFYDKADLDSWIEEQKAQTSRGDNVA